MSPTRRSRSGSARAKHLAAAEFLSSAWSAEEDEIVEVVASHYLDAYRGRARTIQMPARSARRRVGTLARAGGAGGVARRERGGAARIRARDRADRRPAHPGGAARARRRDGRERGARRRRGRRPLRAVDRALRGGGRDAPRGRVSARLAEIMWDRGRLEQALESMDGAFEVLSAEEPDEDVASLAAQLGRFMFFAGETDVAMRANRDGARRSPRRCRCPRSCRRR